MYYLPSSVLPQPKLLKLLEYCCQWNVTDRNLGDQQARQALFKILGWPLEKEPDSSIIVGKLDPGQKTLIHKDASRDTYKVKSAFNIPVNSSAGFQWYKGRTEEAHNRSVLERGFPVLDEHEAEAVETYDCKTSFWLSTADWHRMTNIGNDTAWMISFRWPEVAELRVDEIDPAKHYPWITSCTGAREVQGN